MGRDECLAALEGMLVFGIACIVIAAGLALAFR